MKHKRTMREITWVICDQRISPEVMRCTLCGEELPISQYGAGTWVPIDMFLNRLEAFTLMHGFCDRADAPHFKAQPTDGSK